MAEVAVDGTVVALLLNVAVSIDGQAAVEDAAFGLVAAAVTLEVVSAGLAVDDAVIGLLVGATTLAAVVAGLPADDATLDRLAATAAAWFRTEEPTRLLLKTSVPLPALAGD